MFSTQDERAIRGMARVLSLPLILALTFLVFAGCLCDSAGSKTQNPRNATNVDLQKRAIDQLNRAWTLFSEYERESADRKLLGLPARKKIESRLEFCEQAISDYEMLLLESGESIEQAKETSNSIRQKASERLYKETAPRETPDGYFRFGDSVTSLMLKANSARLTKYRGVGLKYHNMSGKLTSDGVEMETTYEFSSPIDGKRKDDAVAFLELPWQEQDRLISKEDAPPGEHAILAGPTTRETIIRQIQEAYAQAIESERLLVDDGKQSAHGARENLELTG